MATVSIIIPAYNEAENLPATLEPLGMVFFVSAWDWISVHAG